MIRNLFFAAIAAGLLAGVFATGAQLLKVVPLILEAETYETATSTSGSAQTHAHGETATGGHSHDHGHGDAWAPEDGFERILSTLMANILAGVAFACLLGAAIMFSNRDVTAANGLLWGLAGFFVFSLSPALGLAPELPGMDAAALGSRQGWWILTVVCSAAGLGLIAFGSHVAFKIAGVVLLVVPHVVGAPQIEAHSGPVPAGLSAEFAVASLATAALFWLVLGSSLCGLLDRFDRKA